MKPPAESVPGAGNLEVNVVFRVLSMQCILLAALTYITKQELICCIKKTGFAGSDFRSVSKPDMFLPALFRYRVVRIS